MTTQAATPGSRPTPGSPLHFAPGTVFAGRFTIIEQVGAGGMGVVYKAIDGTLHQEVALKLLRPDLASLFPYVERFKREVRVARQLSHPNVCRVYDLGECDGVLFLSMEWVRGETLRDLLARAGKLDEGRALEIAEKIARGLHAAHERGVVHRDLKPRNVMIDDGGEVLVMDFGVAAEIGESTLTGPLGVVGTPAYMAPEQQAGGRVDGRADLYALGLVLEEMIGGRTPVPGHARESAERHDTTRGTTLVLSRLLATDPDKRFPTAAAAAEAISRVRASRFPPGVLSGWRRALAAVPAAAWLLVLPLAGLAWWLAGHPGIGGRQFFPSTAEAYFSRGMYYLREEAETLQSIDNAAHMFQRSLDSDSTYAPAWAGLAQAYWMRFERTKDATARDEAQHAGERALALAPSASETRIAQARGLIATGKFPDAVQILLGVVHDDPKNDVAWANLGRASRGQENYKRGLDALHRAIALRPDSFRHHAELGAFLQRSGEYDEAQKEFQRAIELKPDSPTAWINLGASYLHQGEPQKAIGALEQALRYEQRPATYTNLGTAYYFVGDYARAAENYRLAAAADTANATFAGNLGDGLRMQGKAGEAAAAYREAMRRARAVLALTPDDQALRAQLALWCARAGDRAAALSETARITRAQPQDATVLYTNAVVRATLGLDEEALDWLERAARRGLGRADIEHDPDLARLRANPRFRRVLALAG
jgi:tetratricopeptide (TPR) repeat protein/predicted Ser/Thr protein kinase